MVKPKTVARISLGSFFCWSKHACVSVFKRSHIVGFQTNERIHQIMCSQIVRAANTVHDLHMNFSLFNFFNSHIVDLKTCLSIEYVHNLVFKLDI